MSDKIVVKGARVHNLKNLNVTIPKNKLVVFTGLSGSGKSSLAFDTIYAEGQRRYAESLSSYARQFMDVRDKPDVDSVDGLSPTIAIDQKIFSQNPRSTVGTTTEIYDYLRLLFARIGEQYCPDCNIKVEAQTSGEIIEAVRKKARAGEVLLFAPLVRNSQVEGEVLLDRVEKSGLEWVRINGMLMKINALPDFNFVPERNYHVEVLVGRITDMKKQNLVKIVENALELGNGLLLLSNGTGDKLFSTVGLCTKCNRTMPVLDMRSFSFNSPYGACSRCTGLGVTMEVNPNLVIPNNRLTLAEGAIQPWTRITGNQNWYQKVLAQVAEKHKFSLNIPVKDLSAEVMNIVFYGTGEEFYLVDDKKVIFSGVIPNLVQRHLETDSEYVRKEIELYMQEAVCPACHGLRLRPESLAVKIAGKNIAEVSKLDIDESKPFFKDFSKGIKIEKEKIAEPILREILKRMESLSKVGLGYLSLNRSLNTLSGGEVTRVRLATQLSTGLLGVVYILDEPSVGLHSKDNKKLIDTLHSLRDLGNTVIVVEHDAAMMAAADYIIDVGPGAGVMGGQVVAQGTLSQIKRVKDSLTGGYLSGRLQVDCLECSKKYKSTNKKITVVGAKGNNLKNITVDIPLGKLVCVTGVSGSGKSTLVIDILSKALSRHFYRAKDQPADYRELRGVENIDKVISIDQSPIGRTPRSNPATYTGVFTLIRDLFSELLEAKVRGYDAGKFSFNVKGGGRCEVCAGEGYVRIPMQFLADVFVKCDECGGARYNQEALEIHYKNKNISDVLNMTVEEAYAFFNDKPAIADKLNLLREVGLGYVELGQPATTLSGGEAQRVKLATELSRVSTGKTLYILDEPTTGLHFEDIRHLLVIIDRLVAKGNTVLIIEHNLDVIRCADWIIDLGPEGGRQGGELVAVGTPSEVAQNKKSWTGKFLN